MSEKVTVQVLLIASLFLLPVMATAEGFNRGRLNVYNYDGHRGAYHHSGPIFSPVPQSQCFPFGCGGIEGPFTNPNPDARKPENLTACIYDAQGALLYEREGKVCSYKYIDQNQMRVERRRLE